MKSLLLLAAVCCLVWSAVGSPIARPEESHLESREVAVARQAAAAPAAAASSDDDDDDEDDDDDVDLDDALAGDDDDDDEEEDDEEADDDEDDDYLERFFDDILGGEEDDDDDDEPSGVQPVVAPADTVAAAPAAPAAAAVAEDAAAASEEVADAANEADAASNEVDEPLAGQKEPEPAEADAAAASSEVAAAADPEEDDDEEDDIADALDPEDDDEEDDDDDEEDDDDDDDDDDDITDALGRNVSKHSRALEDKSVKKPPVPAVYIIKYNKFVDNILEKMNDVLRRSYDPVSVKLQPIDASKKSNKPKKNKNKTKSNKKKSAHKKKNSARAGPTENRQDEIPTSSVPAEQPNKIEENLPINEEKTAAQATEAQSRALKEKATENAKAKATTTKPKAKPKPKPKPTVKPPVKSSTKKPPIKNKTKNTNDKEKNKSKPRAKGTLYGLSSLRRVGDVAVSIMSEHTTIKSNFAVGPLILRVEKEVGRGAKKEIKSATATTAEMTGKISLRVNNQGVATLHSIKVLQPKQVRVDSNHERTRELVWRRSARIAHVVSEKLLTVSKPMFYQHDEQ